MSFTQRGRVQGGAIVFSQPLPIAEGTEVHVRIEPVAERWPQPQPAEEEAFEALAFFGMWADREDMADSAVWVSRERQQWQQRMTRRD